jgi:hypothetical protein
MFFALALPALVHGWTGPPRLGREQGQHYWLLRPAGGGDLYGVPKATEQGQVLAHVHDAEIEISEGPEPAHDRAH